jgi:flavin-dependent dehydrogenase
MSAVRADVVIVGGGPAGLTAATAILDAKAALKGRVVVLEKSRYPRDKYCAGALGRRGDQILARLGIRPEVPGVTIDGISLAVASAEHAVRIGGIGRVVRRIELDAGIAALARERGVEIIEDAKVERVDVDRDGAALETAQGRFEARIVVGCDGVGSVVRKAAGVGPGALRAQVLELDTPSVPRDRERGLIHFDASDRSLSGYTWDFPTVVSGEPLVCRGIYHLKLAHEVDAAAPSADFLTKKLGERLATMGLDIATYKNKRFAERGVEMAETFAKGPLMLAGEAAGIDPITGEGIAQAIEYGAMVGPHVALALAGDVRVEGWTARVRRSRLGRDLAIRERFVRELYGGRRPELERVIVRDEFLRAGSLHFGALPMDWRAASLAMGRLAVYFARGVVGLPGLSAG